MRHQLATFICLTGLLSVDALATKTLQMQQYSPTKNPMGIRVYEKIPRESFPRTSIVVDIDRGRTLPTVYLNYNDQISDVVPPWTESEYHGIMDEPSKIVIQRRGVFRGFIQDYAALRVLRGQTPKTGCGIYSATGDLIAYCDTMTQAPSFVLREPSGGLLVQFHSESGELILEDHASDTDIKTFSLNLAALRMWR